MLTEVMLAGLVGWVGIAQGAPRADWTVLGYLSGDGGLEPTALDYMHRLASAPATGRVSIAVEIDRGPGFSSEAPDFTDTRRVVFGGSRDGVGRRWNWTGWRAEANMGDPRTLVDFVSWGARALPADRYLVLLMGHGSGVRPLTEGAARRDSGVAYDATSGGDSLTPREIGAAGSRIVEVLGGRQIAVLAIDACFSASVEVACQVRGDAQYMTGSPNLLHEPGVPWDEVLQAVCKAPDSSAEDVARLAVRELETREETTGTPQGSYVAVRVGATGELETALLKLSDGLRERMEETAPIVTAARAEADQGGLSGEMLDLGGFLRALSVRASEAGYSTIGESAAEAWRKLQAVVVASHTGREDPPANAPRTLSAFFPRNLTEFPADYMDRSRFARSSGWGALLEAYLGHLERLVSPLAAGSAGAGA